MFASTILSLLSPSLSISHSLSPSHRVQGFIAVAQFIVVVGASLVIGILMGMAGALFTRFTAHVHGQSSDNNTAVSTRKYNILWFQENRADP